MILDVTKEKTKNNTGITFIVAINYGSRDEITRGFRQIAREVKDGKLDPDEIMTPHFIVDAVVQGKALTEA